MRLRKNIVSAAVAGGLLLALPGTAGAPKIFGLPNASGGCSVVGVGDGSYVGGALTVSSFDVKEETLVANVELTAACKIADVFQPQTEATGTADTSLLEATDELLIFSLAGTAGAKDATFVIESALEVAAEKSAKSLVKKVNRDPEISTVDLAALLNKYLGKK